MKDLEKMLMKKKSSGEMSKEEIQAKMEVLQELMEMCQQKMGSDVKNGMDEMQKVTVAAPDQESLLEGLEKAHEIAENPAVEALAETSDKEDEDDTDDLEDDEDDSIFARLK